MARIWVVERGEYSDYHVVGVFSTRENAERVAKVENEGREYGLATVEEWPLDPGIAEMNAGLVRFFVLMRRDGTTVRAHQTDFSFVDLDPILFDVDKRGGLIAGHVIAKDEAHAVKIANEYRAQAIAEGKL